MSGLSGKKDQLQKIFDHMNYRKLDRIDAMEFIAAILVCIDDTFEQLLHNVVFIFGFSAGSTQRTITVEEFFFFLDCLFRGVMTFVAPPSMIYNKLQSKRTKENPKFKCLGKKIDPNCIDQLCQGLFQGKPCLDVDGLQTTLKQSQNAQVQQFYMILLDLTGNLKTVVMSFHRSRPMKAIIRAILLGMVNKDLLEKLKENEAKKQAGAPATEPKDGTAAKDGVQKSSPPQPDGPRPKLINQGSQRRMWKKEDVK